MAEPEDIQLVPLADDTPTLDDINWDDEKHVLNDFRADIGLPQVVKFDEGETGGNIPPGLKIYCNQPVLFHTHTSKRQARARTIYRDQTGPFYEVGQTLLIPEDFEGWFELVPPDFSRASCCRTIRELAEVMPAKFFTRTNLRGIRITDENGSQEIFERKIRAGSVLRVDSIFTAKWRTTAKTGMFKKSNKEFTTVEEQYLKCIDIDNKEVLISLSTKGKFNIVYAKGVNDGRTVFRIKDLIDDFTLPMKVKLIYGKPPVVPCIFTGILILKGHKSEDSIVASTILNQRNVLFEVPMDASCSVYTTADDFSKMETYSDALKLCDRFARSYSAMIKLSADLDTGNQMIQHIPTEKMKRPNASLKTLDLITNISYTDDEPQDQFMDSDAESLRSYGEQAPLQKGQLVELQKSDRDSVFC
ncbi:hypothetical protein ScPMuIL_001272 [Solemya velum]